MTTIFRKIQIKKEKLKEIILKTPECLLPGLSFIDLKLGTEEEGFIDFLGVDKAGHLVIVNLATDDNEQILIAALSQMNWLEKNKGLIKKLFFSENVDFEQPPKILLVGPGFSGKLKSAAKQIMLREIKFVEFKYELI